jgi:Ras-related protein Rab-1A
MENTDNKENEEKQKQEDEDTEEDIQNLNMERLGDTQLRHDYIFRVCLIGDSNVGKTSLLTRFCDSSYKENYNNTIGVDFRVISLKYKDIIVKIHIWDTAGQEKYKSVAVNYFRSTHGFMFIYDITDENSFSNIENWINLAFNNSSNHLINFLVGNKSDLEEERQVTKKEAEEFAKSKDLFFFETSAKNNDNVEKVFQFYTYKLIRYFKKRNMVSDDNEPTTKLTGNFEEIQIEQKKDKCSC